MKTEIRSVNSRARIVLYQWDKGQLDEHNPWRDPLDGVFERERVRYDWVVVDSITDVGDYDMMNRPGIKKLLKLVLAGEVDGVFVSGSFHDMSPYMFEVVMFLKVLFENGVELLDRKEGYISDKKIGFVSEVKGFWAQYSRKE